MSDSKEPMFIYLQPADEVESKNDRTWDYNNDGWKSPGVRYINADAVAGMFVVLNVVNEILTKVCEDMKIGEDE